MKNTIHPNEVNLLTLYDDQREKIRKEAENLSPAHVHALDVQFKRQQDFVNDNAN